MPVSRRQALASLAVLGLPHVKVNAADSPARPAAVPFLVAPRLADEAQLPSPSDVRVEGWLGRRIDASARNRLLDVDMEPLLAGFRAKPGSHPWIGEHVGKWLHAATLAWANKGDAALRAKLDRVAGALASAQEPDGYLGTYAPGKRFGLYDGADWDVWSHKYCLVGLVTYYRYTGDRRALEASRKAADLLVATFPAKKSILAAGTHMGMAATSVLEPVVLLYRVTGDGRYLAFARYIVKSWDEDKGPGILRSLLERKPVTKVANGKAYEMLSNLVGLCELARVTGEKPLVEASLHAWRDIVDRRLYATGTTSQWEHFQPDHDMRGDKWRHLGETCVTTTWIQFNLSLLQLTGEARFGDELERSFYNHLAAAQHPRGDDWCYYTALEGRKQYDKEITCCHSSGPRGMALAPQAAYLRGRAGSHDALLVSTFESSRATLELGGRRVTVEQDSGFPYRGESRLTLRLSGPATFAVKVRVPAWAQPMAIAGATQRAGWAELPPRLWKDGDEIAVRFTLASRLVPGGAGQPGRAALAWGPFVLAYEQEANPALPGAHRLGFARGATAVVPRRGETLAFEAGVVVPDESRPRTAQFRAFADAGSDRGLYRVWLRAPGAVAPAPDESLLVGGQESRSRPGDRAGSILDEDDDSFVSTFDGRPADDDWFAVSLARPATARRIVFTHGKCFHDGGWFDASAGKPRVQVRRVAAGPWETIGELDEYPATTAASAGRLLETWRQSHQFTLRLEAPVTFVAVRVAGKPACGDDPKQAFASCAALQAYSL